MKTLKVRIEPNSEQREAIDHNIESNRLVYNSYLTACRNTYRETGKIPSVFELNRIGTRARNILALAFPSNPWDRPAILPGVQSGERLGA